MRIGHVYILLSESKNRYYVGSTKDVSERVAYHNAGYSKSTKNLRPLKLVFVQKYSNLQEAKQIEYKLKSFKNRKIIETIVKDGYIKTKVGQ